jgi:hypothetical protein
VTWRGVAVWVPRVVARPWLSSLIRRCRLDDLDEPSVHVHSSEPVVHELKPVRV